MLRGVAKEELGHCRPNRGCRELGDLSPQATLAAFTRWTVPVPQSTIRATLRCRHLAQLLVLVSAALVGSMRQAQRSYRLTDLIDVRPRLMAERQDGPGPRLVRTGKRPGNRLLSGPVDVRVRLRSLVSTAWRRCFAVARSIRTRCPSAEGWAAVAAIAAAITAGLSLMQQQQAAMDA